MVVHQVKRDEMTDLWIELEALSDWATSLLTSRLSAGVLLKVVPGGRSGYTLVKRRSVTPFLFL